MYGLMVFENRIYLSNNLILSNCDDNLFLLMNFENKFKEIIKINAPNEMAVSFTA
jgi:hypothetical protein